MNYGCYSGILTRWQLLPQFLFPLFWQLTHTSISYLVQGCQLSRFSRKFPEFEADFTRLRIFDKTAEFCTHSTFLWQNGTERTKQSTCNLCCLAHFQSSKLQKLCRVPTFIGICTVSIIATLIILILWSQE